ncbi:MAG: alpha-hydroxy acid oxidase [Paracoccaceae bacterium]|nr:alpha-hydroxy acid oxidase [Paracoccaceae bacterium]MDG1738229.1 alpha-hydroxy acid oxidase [Paracoccaceae bacterium]MDG2259058.1 alpha-hydroxy acid oxidase [Paracoccaceae bacterium]
MPTITCIDDLKRLYRRRVPKMFYDYAESGSYTEKTFRENTSDFDEIKFRQKIAVDMSNRSTSSHMLTQKAAMPVALAPVGLTGMQHADGEIKAALAARDFGVPYTLSTMSVNSIEQVADATNTPFWFQVYTLNDDDFMRRLMARAKDANCSAIVITLDLQVLGQRHKDIKNGLSTPPKPTLKTILDLSTKWRWGLGMLGAKSRTFGNIAGQVEGVSDPTNLAVWTNEKFDQALDWDRVKELRNMWDGPVILKGIMDPEDAKQAVNAGADAIIVSNHGGRQLDGALSSIRALEPIVEAVGNKVDVYMDSGIRTGQDILKALALGAKGTFIGRSYIYGLGALGQPGVTKALDILQKELDVSMALCGRTSIDQISRDMLMMPNDFSTRWS